MKITDTCLDQMEKLYQVLLTRDVQRNEIRKNYTKSDYETFMASMTYRYPVYEYQIGKKTWVGLMNK